MSNSEDSIKLHPKYGLNPSVETCFWCGKETGSIIIFGGQIRGQAPMHVSVSYSPCDECLEKWEKGFLLIEVSQTPVIKGQAQLAPEAYPTGNYMVITTQAAVELFGEEQTKEGKALILKELFRKLTKNIGKPSNASGEEL